MPPTEIGVCRLGDPQGKPLVPISPDVAHHRARVANAALRGDDDAADSARRDLRAARLEEHIRTVVASAPPLTDAQRNRLAELLRAGSAR